MPSIFQCTAFKKHIQYLLDQNQKEDFSHMFIYLPSTLGYKEALNEYSEHFHLHLIDVSYEQLKALNVQEGFNPAGLDNCSKQSKITKILYFFMKEAAAASNHNLVRNSNAFLANGRKIDPDFTFSWVNDSYAKM